VKAGAWVTYQTRVEQGREVLVSIEPVEPGMRSTAAASQVQALEPGTIYTLNWLPLGGFVRMTGEENPSDPRSFAAQRPLVRALILIAGAGMNVVLAIVLFTLIATAPQVKTIEVVTIEAVSPSSPAESAGIRAGDQLVTIDGQPIENRQDAQRIIYGQAGQEISIVLKRGNQQLTVPVTPRVNPPRDEGPTGIRLCTD